MDEEFIRAVEDGLKLSKRIRGSKDHHHQVPPTGPGGMERGGGGSVLQPASPMVYAVIYDPAIVDNPDVPSYQPHVYGEMDPPALIPLMMNGIGMEVECYLDAALVTVKGSWRVHCVTGSKSCDCRLVLPMGELGSILGVDAAIGKRAYFTQVIQTEEDQSVEKTAKTEAGGYLKPQLFSLIVPQVNGGSVISLSIRWVQKLTYSDGQFSISIPFTFPEFINPSGKTIKKMEKIKLNIHGGAGKEILCQMTSHALKETRRQPGSVGFSYEGEVFSWSKTDFSFSYTVYSNDIFGGILLQPPPMNDIDQRERFCLYFFSGSNQRRKVFRKEIIFVVDISESMNGVPLESVTNALSAATSELTPHDSFNIIAFNDEIYTFSPSLTRATQETVENAIQWMKQSFVAAGGTNFVKPLNEAMHMLSKTTNSIPHVCFITDGAVEEERSICSTMRAYVNNKGSISPRISTFGIGSYCNHYFLRMLASIGRGLYDATFEAGSIDIRMQRFFKRITSPVLANIAFDIFDELDSFEVYPSHVPDLSVGCPLVLVGRYHGRFPETLKSKGLLADMTEFSIELKTQKTDIPLEKVFAKHQIDLMTAQAWLSESKELEQKISRLSIQSGVASEFTLMILRKEVEKDGPLSQGNKLEKQKSVAPKEIPIPVGGLALGFGDVAATAENLPPGFGGESPEIDIQATAARCCGSLADFFCCMCCIRACSRMNDQCAIVMAQVVTALSVLGCIGCCSEMCGRGSD
ncbi:unnamed protein product [Spirodela intermedia]|uniref:VWFA domain-containing protein n=1 Tax=Spirodela intermedia TaxID=51605 RepID=A0A7I8KD00_SPIIN|nr:unnamed protein product [Spirodela intermedia]